MIDCDFLVIGSGAAGLTAAVTAALLVDSANHARQGGQG
jgi:succinate dehydrogenase/fumarate reductase flavoprotein subunit